MLSLVRTMFGHSNTSACKYQRKAKKIYTIKFGATGTKLQPKLDSTRPGAQFRLHSVESTTVKHTKI
jgi:hypothetical protein